MELSMCYEREFIRDYGDMLETYVPKIVLLWKQRGLSATKIEKKLHETLSLHKGQWDVKQEEEEERSQKIARSVDRRAKRCKLLCTELGIKSCEFGEEVPLLEKKKLLKEALVSLNREKEKRQAQYVIKIESIKSMMKQLEESELVPSVVSLCDEEMSKLEVLRLDLISRLEQFQKKALVPKSRDEKLLTCGFSRLRDMTTPAETNACSNVFVVPKPSGKELPCTPRKVVGFAIPSDSLREKAKRILTQASKVPMLAEKRKAGEHISSAIGSLSKKFK